MGRRGPPPQDHDTLAQRGSWKARERTHAPKATGAPEPVCELPEAVDAVWNRLVPLLVKQGTAKEIDADALTRLCYAIACAEAAERVMLDMPLGSMDRRRVFTEWNDATNQILRMSQRFGLTAADRAGLKADTDTEETDGAERFFSITG